MKLRGVLEQNLSNVLDQVKSKRKITNEIQKGVVDNKIPMGVVQNIINGKMPLDEVDERVLCLLTMNVYNVVKEHDSNIDVTRIYYNDYFSEMEIKLAKTYEEFDQESITLPYTFKNVIRINQDHYICPITAQEIKKLWDSGLLVYNYDVQREAKVERDKKDPMKIIQRPRINPRAIKEISQHMKNGTLISSALTLNVRLGTSDEGDELIYNQKNLTLEITHGSLIDCLDGFHRISSVIETLTAFPDVNMNFTLNIVNYGTKQAMEFFAQLNSATPVSTSRLMEMKQARHSDFVVKQVQINSEFLKGKVSSSEHISTLQKHLVSFSVLSDAIDETFSIKNKSEALVVAEYLTEFFDKLFLKNEEAFISNIDEVRKESLINANQFFIGWVILAKRMQDENIKLNKLQSIVNCIDFSRSNPEWSRLGILDSKKNINNNLKNKVKEYFKNLELNGVCV